MAEGYTIPAALTAREREILRLVGSGATNHEIAAHWWWVKALCTHIQHPQEKLGLNNRNQLVLYAVRIELTTPPE